MTQIKILSVVFIVGGVALLYRAWSTIAGHEITRGTVVELRPVGGSKWKRPSYKVVATFQDHMGKKHTYTSSWASYPPENKVGDVIKIMHDRENPERNYRLAFGYRFGLPWVLLGLGLFLLWIVTGWLFGDGIVNSHFPNTH